MNKLLVLFTFIFIFISNSYAKDQNPKTVFTFLYGDGISNISSSSNKDNQHNKRDFKFTVGERIQDSNSYIKFVHINEGHPVDHHRDAFGGVVSYRIPLWGHLSSEVEIGPILTFDTTTIDDIQLDDKNFGILGSIGLIYPITKYISIRAEWNKVFVPSTFDSDMYLIGFEFPFYTTPINSINSYSLTTMGSYYVTNLANTDDAFGGMIELDKALNTDWSISASLINQGNDGKASRPIGLSIRLWKDFNLNENLRISTGLGPFYSKNELSNSSPLNGIISIRPSYKVNEKWSVISEFSRVADFSGNIDCDIFSVGLKYDL